jgi:hypothetical protein
VKLTVHGAFEVIDRHVTGRLVEPGQPTPCIWPSLAGVVHVITYGWPTFSVTLLLPGPSQGPVWQMNVHLLPPLVVAEIVTTTGAGAATTTVFVAAETPAAFPAKWADVYVPAAAYVCWTVAPDVAVAPSPKSQSCSVGAFEEESVNVAACPVEGLAGATV